MLGVFGWTMIAGLCIAAAVFPICLASMFGSREWAYACLTGMLRAFILGMGLWMTGFMGALVVSLITGQRTWP